MPTIEPTSNDTLLVEHYGLHWLEMGTPVDEVIDDWRAEARRFLAEARASSGLAAFSAVTGGASVGTACCHMVPRSFPAFRKTDSARVGYLWGVYVVPEHRGRGIGGMLVSACMEHLKIIGCGRVLLHAGNRSPMLYGRMGFMPTDELSAPL
jgi:GNAT superfamily N-acetyltransferase